MNRQCAPDLNEIRETDRNTAVGKNIVNNEVFQTDRADCSMSGLSGLTAR